MPDPKNEKQYPYNTYAGHSLQATLNGIKNAINKARQKQAEKNKDTYAPIPHFYPHALRHTFATRCFEAGIDAKVVQGFLGHYSIAIWTNSINSENPLTLRLAGSRCCYSYLKE